jgi:hypothetical protein
MGLCDTHETPHKYGYGVENPDPRYTHAKP